LSTARRGELHQLATREGADREHEIGAFDLLGQAVARRVVELIRPMHHEGKADREDLLADQPNGRGGRREMHMQMRLLFAPHPAPDHQRLDKIEQPEADLAEVSTAKPEREEQPFKRLQGSPEQRRARASSGALGTVALDVVGQLGPPRPRRR
jgi:hypothetical protein